MTNQTNIATFFFGNPKPPPTPGCITVNNAYVSHDRDGATSVLLDHDFLAYVDEAEPHCFGPNNSFARLDLTADGV